MQNAESGIAGTEVDDGDLVLHATVRHLVHEEVTGIFECKRFNIDDTGHKARRLDRSLALIDVLGTGGDQQDVEHLGIGR